MQITPTIPTAAIYLVAGFVIFALVAGLALGGQELFNPELSQAKIRQIDSDRIAQERVREQQLEYQKKQQEQALLAQRERQQIELALFEFGGVILIGALGLAVVIAGGGFAYYLIFLGRRNWAMATVQAMQKQQLLTHQATVVETAHAGSASKSSESNPLEKTISGNGHGQHLPFVYRQRSHSGGRTNHAYTVGEQRTSFQ